MVPAGGRSSVLGVLSGLALLTSGLLGDALGVCRDYRLAPHRISSISIPPGGLQLAVDGRLGAVAAGEGGALVLELADVYAPSVAATLDLPGYVRSVDVAGERLYASDGNTLSIHDIANPSAPVLLSSWPAPNCGSLAADGTRLYSIAGNQLFIYDVTDATAPSVVSFLTIAGGFPLGLAAHEDVVYLACNPDIGGPLFVAAIDVSPPAQPHEEIRFSLSDFNVTSFGIGIELRFGTPSGDLLVAGGASIVDLFDVSGHFEPVSLGTSFCDGAGLALTDTHLLNGCGATLAFATLPPPVIDGFVEASSYVVDVAVEGRFGFALLDGGDAALAVFDLGDSDLPDEIGSAWSMGSARSLRVAGDRLYSADGGAGLHIYDVSDPAEPVLLGSHDTPSVAYAVTVSPPYVFVCDGASGLRVIDVSVPSSPQPVTVHDTPGTAYGSVPAGNHLLIADGSGGLRVLDVSDPTSPTLAAVLPMPDTAFRVAVEGTLACVAGGNETGFLQVVDVSDPTAPTPLGMLPLSHSARGVQVVDDVAYVASLGGIDGTGRVFVVSLANPKSPNLLQEVSTSLPAYDVALQSGIAFVAGGSMSDGPVGRAWVYDFSKPEVASLLATFDADHIGRGVAVSEDAVYAAFSAEGIRVYEAQCAVVSDVSEEETPSPDASRISLRAWPNPTGGPVRFRCSAREFTARDRLAIFAADGRLVRTLTPTGAPANAPVWDGLDSEGRAVRSGVYFVRSSDARGPLASTRVLVVR